MRLRALVGCVGSDTTVDVVTGGVIRTKNRAGRVQGAREDVWSMAESVEGDSELTGLLDQKRVNGGNDKVEW